MKQQFINCENIEIEKVPAGSLRKLFDSKEYPGISITHLIELDDPKFRTHKNDVFYYVLTGFGTFTLKEEEHVVENGDLVFIPKNVQHKNSPDITLLMIQLPGLK
jgi:mannose-6-phosphate isomerase-like protein (cupin superfamily)